MTQKIEKPLKDLLIKDLCMRLPYNPMVDYKGESYNVLGITHGRLVLCKPFMSYTLNDCPLVKEVKPYLLPLSSMTEEELREYNYLYAERENNNEADDIEQYSDLIDWFNKHHFDYRGLIEKSLALDATNLNIY